MCSQRGNVFFWYDFKMNRNCFPLKRINQLIFVIEKLCVFWKSGFNYYTLFRYVSGFNVWRAHFYLLWSPAIWQMITKFSKDFYTKYRRILTHFVLIHWRRKKVGQKLRNSLPEYTASQSKTQREIQITWKFLFLSFRRVLNVICSFLGNSPAS